MPKNFDISSSSGRYAVIDATEHPAKIHSRTTHQRREVVSFLQRPELAGRTFRILDFRAGKEFRLGPEAEFVECARFDPTYPGEVLHLVAP